MRSLRILCYAAGVTRPRFKPADAVVRARQFGRAEDPAWDPGCGLTPEDFGWARIQHRVALYVRDELEREGSDEAGLAAEMGVSASWLTRKLNGQAPIDLAEMVWWTRRFGPQVWPVIDDPSELEVPNR